jgi:hypothetical protein
VDDASRIATAKQYLRRTYADNINGLKALAAQVAESAFSAVTITGQTFEGGSAQGTVTFEKMAYLTAVEAVIAELDTTAPRPSIAAVAYFR